MKKQKYLDMMEQVVSAYSQEQIEAYIERVRETGITEHGFPRLGANLGILIAHGKMQDRKPYFLQIMELCCEQIPNPPVLVNGMGNDFSVRELVLCLLELEKSDVVPAQDIQRWKESLAKIEPYKTYNVLPSVPPTAIGNWVAFNAVSEQARVFAGLAHTEDYIENAVESQLFSFEESGMYRDPNEPMVYDLVTRVQLSSAVFLGYNGKNRTQLDAYLEKAGKLTLLMQSVTGEIPFGGRSNQFLHNEAHLAAMCEFEALRHRDKGDLLTAGAFKAAARLAVDSITKWLSDNPGHHIKNYYPIYSKMGCENYAYYDKYMVTTASFLYSAYLFADDAIEETRCPAQSGSHVWETGPWFHKLFCKSGSYFVELEMKADDHYDASGIGRIQRRGAPGPICIATSVSQRPSYNTGTPNDCPLSICPGVFNGAWQFAWDWRSHYRVTEKEAVCGGTEAAWEVLFEDGSMVTQRCKVDRAGVLLTTEGNGTVGLLLPVLAFDGAEETKITVTATEVAVSYRGWCCRYVTDGRIVDAAMAAVNRNGKYKVFRAEGEQAVTVTVTIEKEA